MRLIDGSSRNSGRLQFFNPASQTGWQDYCGSYYNDDQGLFQVVCRTLGYDSDLNRIVYSSKKNSHIHIESAMIVIFNSSCLATVPCNWQ